MEQVVQNNTAVRTRTVRSEDQILKLLEEYDASGFSVKDFCEVSDINEATFYTWIKKYRNKPEEETGFAPIEVIPTIVNKVPQLFAEVQVGNLKLYKEVSAEYLKTLLS